MPELVTYQIADNFYSIEQGFVRSFLIVGEREALLIDTGVGNQKLKEYIETITRLPITVVFTHADGDHVGGADQFERRFMHPSEFDYYASKKTNQLPMEAIWEGDIIDLGNYRFEIILIPGHTPGSIALLERGKRFLIGGDSIQTGNIFMFGNGRNFEAYGASMKKLQGILHDFEIVYSSHHQLAVNVDIVNLLSAAADKMMNGMVEGVPVELGFDVPVKSYETDGVAFFAF